MPAMIIVDADSGFKLKINEDGSINTTATFSGTLEVNLDHANDDVLIYGNDGSTDRKILTDSAGVTQVGSSTLATAAKQDTGNTSAATIAAAILAQASNTSGQTGILSQGATTTSAPTYVNAKTNPLSLTTAGDLRTVFSNTTIGVTGTFFQATQPVSAAALPLPSGAATEAKQDAGNTDLATIVSNTGSIASKDFATETTLGQVRDDADLLTLSLILPGTTNAVRAVLLGAEYNSTPPQTNSGDQGKLQIDTHNNLKVTEGCLVGPGIPKIDSYQSIPINLSAGNDQVLVSSAANKQIWVYGITFLTDIAGTVSFQDEDNTAITGIMPFPANGGLARDPSGNFAMPIWKLDTNKDLEVDLVTCAIDGDLEYAIVDVS